MSSWQIRVQRSKSWADLCKARMLKSRMNAVMDLVRIILTYPIDEKIEAVSQAEVDKLVKYYDNFMYQALLHCTKNSLNAIKTRLGKSRNFGGVGIKSPMFQISLQM